MDRNAARPMMDTPMREKLINGALGREKADLVIENATLVNVYTGEIQENMAVSIFGEWIAYVGHNPGHTIGPATEVMDASGMTLIPGLIDGHTHLAWLFTVDEFLRHAAAGGTTTVVTETMEAYPVAGHAGVVDFLDSLTDQPIKIFATAPPMMSISRKARGIRAEDLENLLSRPEIIGLGEAYWQAMIQETDRMLPLFEQTLAAGKCLEGHSAGASENKLMAYLASGISSCHEPINAGEVLDRLRLGLHVMVREGSIRSDLKEISKIQDARVDSRRMILVTDGIEPRHLIQKGYMEFVVQKAIRCGFDPVTAIQMATLNVAEHFSLDHIIGGIAPGRQADLVIIPDPATIAPKVVVSKGIVIARDGKLEVEPRKHVYSPDSRRTVNLPNPFASSDFTIRAPSDAVHATVRMMDLVTSLVTREKQLGVVVKNGEVVADPERDLLKIAAVDRTHVPGKHFVGLIGGFGIRAGAVASSAAWDTSDIIVVGADDMDMAMAVNRIHELQGGVVVCEGGDILAELPLPVFGLISEQPMAILADGMDRVKEQVVKLGFPYDDPLLTLITLTGQAIPFFRICEEGLVDFKSGETVSLFVGDPAVDSIP